MPDLVPQLDPSERYMQCCEACAFNFPAMLLLAGGDLGRSNLHATFTDLVFDPHPAVRRLIAAGFHEVRRERLVVCYRIVTRVPRKGLLLGR